MCLYVFVCDYLYLGVISWVFRVRRVFWSLVSKSNLVISGEGYFRRERGLKRKRVEDSRS